MRVQAILTRLSRLSRQEQLRLSAQSGVPFGTLEKVALGITRNPSSLTLEAIERALQKQDGSSSKPLRAPRKRRTLR